MSNFSMSDLLRETEEKFGDFEFDLDRTDDEGNEVIETLKFRYYLRLTPERRARLAAAVEANSNLDLLDQEGIYALLPLFKEAVKAIAVSEDHYEKLAERFGDDLVYWGFFVGKYAEHYEGGAPSGELVPSENS